MSAWIVSKGHIDLLVQGLVQEGVVDPTVDRDALGQMLWDENHASVNDRYAEDTPTPVYTHHGVEARLDKDHLFVAAGCYDYQSCEHPGWEASEARRLNTDLYERLEARGAKHHIGGHVPWGHDSIEQAVVV